MLAILICATTAFADEACRKVQHLGDSYTVCTFDPAKDGIRLYENDRSGKPYGSFRALENDLRQDRIQIRFAMNGGMYRDDQSPVGLYIEEGKQQRAINTNKGWGNFHLLPNGVFYIEQGRAGIMESKAFVASGIKPIYATQSGPMLVIDGKLHPSFLADSTSFKIRNGVGVSADGKVIFAVSDGAVRFHDFATLFRDDLRCANALFLDGSISSLDIPEWQRRDELFPLGPIIAVTELLPG
ncbi:phosphodiester glycosidase family protein [Rhizobium sp. CB3090]|uniref:phosphodiester glycosidase family protein n=1 Tax=Rhizobium sp. CB3090 TaxID=3039156 RepID=UPI0024B25D37|nr:phosphodiester glycosidase family protein [Rhizobium sp. CB3090]WFU11039.1 phosphodiester glycosidase family protein [Rhizobium sp. CB3090]